MAVKATFLADFTSFQTAVSQAETKLRSFESGAASVEKALTRMADGFSGRRVLQDADLAVKAVKDLGGVTTLTAAEQARLNVTVQEALAKYKALGQEAPAELQKVSKELAVQKLSFKDLAVAAGAIAGIVAGASAAIGKLGERGAGVNDVKEQFVTLTGAIGETSDAILNKLQKATLGTISNFDLMKTANLAMSQGLTLTADQFGTLGDTAAVLADRTGVDLKTAFDTLTQAMATGQDRTLKTIGLNIDAAKAEEDYARSIGKKRGELDESEKKHAIQNAILQEGQNILAVSGKAQEDFADKVGQSSASISNFVDRIGSWIATNPSIGAWTSTITAASSFITAMGLAFGPVSAGLTKLAPLVAGLGGTFATMGTVITATVIPALTGAFALITPFLVPLGLLAAAIGSVYLAWKYWDEIVAFFQGAWTYVVTALKEAPNWLLALLGPIGAVVAVWRNWDAIVAFFKGAWTAVVTAVKEMPTWLLALMGPIGAVVTAWKNWDKIVGFVKAVYDAAKQWLVDKFNGIVNSIKGSIQAVGDKFKWLYDVVVGNSYIPDLIDGIDTEFGRLPDVLVRPTEQATRTAGEYFRDFAGKAVQTISRAFGDMLTGATSFKDGFLGIWRGLQGLLSDILGDILENTIGGFIRNATGQLSGLSGAIGSFTGGLGGVNGGLIGGAVSAIGAGIGAFADHLRGGEEGMFVNPRRDQFLLQFGAPGTGEGSGFNNLAVLLNSLGKSHLFGALIGADKVESFTNAEQLIADALAQVGQQVRIFHTGGMVPGTGNVPAILQGGERVLSRTEAEDYNNGSMTITGPVSIVINDARDPDAVAEAVAERLIDFGRRNHRQTRTRLRGAYGIA